MSQPAKTLVVIKSKGCPACIHYENGGHHAQLEQLCQNNGIQLELVQLQTNAERIDPLRFPAQLQAYVAWYPEFLLFNTADWEKMKMDRTYLPPSSVFNGRMIRNAERNSIVPADNRQPQTGESIYSWAQTTTPGVEYQAKSMGDPSRSGFVHKGIKSEQVLCKRQWIKSKN